MLYNEASSRGLTIVFGLLLLFAAFSEISGLARRMRFRGWVAWLAGALSGMLGGLVGNQGGIRSAALIGFGLRKELFVGTATAIALFVDGARVPVYLYTQHDEMRGVVSWIALAIVAWSWAPSSAAGRSAGFPTSGSAACSRCSLRSSASRCSCVRLPRRRPNVEADLQVRLVDLPA